MRRNTGVTHGRSWNLGPGGSEKKLKVLSRIWVFIFFSYIFCCRKDRFKECRETLWGQGQAEMGNVTNQGRKGREIQLRGNI